MTNFAFDGNLDHLTDEDIALFEADLSREVEVSISDPFLGDTDATPPF